jgi:hypothetical protein
VLESTRELQNFALQYLDPYSLASVLVLVRANCSYKSYWPVLVLHDVLVVQCTWYL